MAVTVSIEQLERLAAMANPEAPKTATGRVNGARKPGSTPSGHPRPGGSPEASLAWVKRWMEKHGIEGKEPKPWKEGGFKIVLPVCPFNSAHVDKACITVAPDGQMGFTCQKASCTSGWQALRDHIEGEDRPRSGAAPERGDEEAPPARGTAARTRTTPGRDDTGEEQEAQLPEPEPTWAPKALYSPGERALAAKRTLLDRYIRYASMRTDAPKEFHEALGLVAIATAVGRKACLKMAVGDVYPSLFVMIIAPSSIFHKSTALDFARDLIDAVDPLRLAPNEFTPQRFIAIMAENDGTPLAFFRDEFGGFYDGLNRCDYMSGLKEALNNIYDCRPFKREKMRPKQGKDDEEMPETTWRFNIEQPFLSMGVATTPQRFMDVAKEEDIGSGWLPRFAIILPPMKRGKRKKMTALTDAIVQARGDLVTRLQAIVERQITLTAEEANFERFDQYQRDLEAEAEKAPNSELAAVIAERIAWMAMHIGMLLAVADGSNRVKIPHLLRGIVIAEGWRHNALSIFGALAPSKFERKAAQVVQFVDGRGEAKRRDVMRHLRIKVAFMNELELTLKERGEIRVEQRPTKSHRETVYISVRVSTASTVSPGSFSNGGGVIPVITPEEIVGEEGEDPSVDDAIRESLLACPLNTPSGLLKQPEGMPSHFENGPGDTVDAVDAPDPLPGDGDPGTEASQPAKGDDDETGQPDPYAGLPDARQRAQLFRVAEELGFPAVTVTTGDQEHVVQGQETWKRCLGSPNTTADHLRQIGEALADLAAPPES